MTSLNSQGRFDFLDSIRGIAALMVAYLHYSAFFLREDFIMSSFEFGLMHFFNEYIDLGKVGVLIFFAISGMVIPFSLSKGGEYPVRRFFVSRVMRLYPVYWLSIPAGLYAYYYLGGKEITTEVIVLNMTMFQQFFLVENIIGLYWTLQVEIIFYVMCIVLYKMNWLFNKKRIFMIALAFLALALGAAIVRYYTQSKIPVGLLLALVFMFLGALWREYIFLECLEAKRYSVVILISVLLSMPAISLLAYNQDMGFGETWYRYVLTYYSAVFMIVTLTRFCHVKGRIFVWLGSISYSVYLFHHVIFLVLIDTVGEKTLASLGFPVHLYIAFSMIATIAVSSLTFRYIEQPMIKLGRNINNGFFKNEMDCAAK
ncbi:MAG: peptidoglycan/LPS O-acetylase OafA/YrhL [Paraglaciecola sp.]|jgi:peptidoglycan/LPS O-acetylase OafA/YrhL